MKKYIVELLLRSGTRVLHNGLPEEHLSEVRNALDQVSAGGVRGCLNINGNGGINYAIPWASIDSLSFIEIDVEENDEERIGVVSYPDSIGPGTLEKAWTKAYEVTQEEGEQSE